MAVRWSCDRIKGLHTSLVSDNCWGQCRMHREEMYIKHKKTCFPFKLTIDITQLIVIADDFDLYFRLHCTITRIKLKLTGTLELFLFKYFLKFIMQVSLDDNGCNLE